LRLHEFPSSAIRARHLLNPVQRQMRAASRMNDCKLAKRFDSGRVVDDSTSGLIAEFIINVPLFQSFDTRDIDILSRYFKLYHVEAGAIIFEEGEEGTFMALVMEGRVELRKRTGSHGLVTISVEGTGRLLGEMALIDGEPRSATATFVKPGRMLMMPRENYERLIREHPRLGFKLLFQLSRVLSQRLRRATGLLSDHLEATPAIGFAK
jgi:CRP/FNR family transcriptional regulator, cyclic AMP receptor protein